MSVARASTGEALGLPEPQALRHRRARGVDLRVRVERALRLLAEGELPVSAVALEAGFANQSHLSVWMRRIVGTTPGAFRHGAQTFDRIRNRANLSDGGRLELLRLPTPEEEAYEQARRGMHL